MPCLLMANGALVKTVKFKERTYVGDPVNAVRIFNQKEVDELILLDIEATTSGRGIDYETIEKVVSECFMPICYGGGVRTLDDMRRLFNLGVEKISISAAAFEVPHLISHAAAEFGRQAVVVTLDVRKGLLGRYATRIRQGRKEIGMSAVEAAKHVETQGAGEICVYSMDRDGTWSGFDLRLVKDVAQSVRVPVIACGGAGSISDVQAVVHEGGASAVAIGSMAVFQGKDLGVLIKFPPRNEQEAIFR